MRGRKLSFRIALSAEERAELDRRYRMTTSPVGEHKRARAILLLDAKLTETETAKRCGLGARIAGSGRVVVEAGGGTADKPCC